MSYPYFFVDAGSAGENEIKIGGEDLNHLKNVLRARVGDLVYVSDSQEFKYRTEVTSIGRSEIKLSIKNREKIIPKSPGIVLFQCALKKNSMEFVIQKSTEIGVDKIVPVTSERVVSGSKKVSGKIKRWQKISDGASKQCKRDFKCEVSLPVDIGHIDVSEYDFFFIPYEKSTAYNKSLIGSRRSISNASKAAFLIGPEGGFSDDEVSSLESKGAIEIKLGENIYRSETAAIYFLSVLDYLIGSRK
ncbi:MAG: RsmE family RNA methyltransferase [Actinomycetota bacterium]|nr:RsmE family RNA methyltransferase [Actinomycetota bacterium]